MTDQKIRLKALELAVERCKYRSSTISTFQFVNVFERYLNGEDSLYLDEIVSEWGDTERELRNNQFEREQEEEAKIAKEKREKERKEREKEAEGDLLVFDASNQKSIFERVFGK